MFTSFTFTDASYVVGIPAAMLMGLMLVAIGLSVTRPEGPHLVRRHTGPARYYRSVGSDLSDATSELIVHHMHQPRHAEDELDDPIWVMEQQIEGYASVGRRSIDSPVRHMPVPQDWAPPLLHQNVRIALLETPTAQYLFARKPKDQLDTERTQFVRAYAYAG